MRVREDDGVRLGGPEAEIRPCQSGGDPDCTQCGCLASVGLAAVGDYRLAGVLPVRALLDTSHRIGQAVRRQRVGEVMIVRRASILNSESTVASAAAREPAGE